MVIISSFSEPIEGIKHQQPDVKLVFDEREIGKGTLYITESVVAFQNDISPSTSFCIEYYHISLHAICKDPSAYPQPCMYVMLDGQASLPGDPDFPTVQESAQMEDDNFDETSITELRFVPDDENALDAMFAALKLCQELNPDPEESMSDDSDDGAHGDDDNFSNEEVDSESFSNLHLNGSSGAGDAPSSRQFEDAD